MCVRRGLIALSVGLAYLMTLSDLAYAVDWSTWEVAATDKAYGEVTLKTSFKGYARVGFDATGWINQYHGDWKLKCRTGFQLEGTFPWTGPESHSIATMKIPRKSRKRYCIARLWVQSAAHAGDYVNQVEGTIYVKPPPS